MYAPLTMQRFFKSSDSGLKRATIAMSALILLTAATQSLAAPQAVELLRFHCEGEQGHRAVHIYQAGSKKSGEGGVFGKCNAEGPLGACMTEPFEGSTPVTLRNSSIQSSDTRSVTTLCHTVADHTKAPSALYRGMYGAGISLPATGPGFMSAGGTRTQAAIDFVYSTNSGESDDLIASDGRWKREGQPAKHLYFSRLGRGVSEKNQRAADRNTSYPHRAAPHRRGAARDGAEHARRHQGTTDRCRL